jgi:hypothetical protein
LVNPLDIYFGLCYNKRYKGYSTNVRVSARIYNRRIRGNVMDRDKIYSLKKTILGMEDKLIKLKTIVHQLPIEEKKFFEELIIK